MNKVISNSVLGKNIRSVRKSRRITQQATVEKMNEMGSPISRGTFSQIEMGIANIYATDLVALSMIFQVDLSVFFEGIGTERFFEQK